MDKLSKASWYWEREASTCVPVYYTRGFDAYSHLYIHGDVNRKNRKFRIRLNEMKVSNTVQDDKIIAGPFTTLKAAKVAYLLMQG